MKKCIFIIIINNKIVISPYIFYLYYFYFCIDFINLHLTVINAYVNYFITLVIIIGIAKDISLFSKLL